MNRADKPGLLGIDFKSFSAWKQRHLFSLFRANDGIVMVYVAVALPLIVGLSVLSVDVGRLASFDTSLQSNLDALAISAATELDRRPDAHLRACLAMQTLVFNRLMFADGKSRLTIACDAQGNHEESSDVEWSWLSSLPARDQDPITDVHLSTDPASTIFVRLTLRAQAIRFKPIFPLSFVGASPIDVLPRESVAGFSQSITRPLGLFVCNPWEADRITSLEGLRSKIGSHISVWERSNPQSNAGSGNFGLAVPASRKDGVCNSADNPNLNEDLERLLSGRSDQSAERSPSHFYGVCPVPGVRGMLQAAINTRFDIYEGKYRNLGTIEEADDLYPAARSVWRLGQFGSEACRMNRFPTSSAIWYPRENNWDRYAYFASAEYPAFSSVDVPGKGQTSVADLTRYETYLWETTQNNPLSAPYALASADTCFAARYPGGNAAAVALLESRGLAKRIPRRDVYAAIVNCGEIEAANQSGSPYSLNGASGRVALPTLAVGKFFITEPVNKVVSAAETTDISNPRNASNTLKVFDPTEPDSFCPYPVGSGLTGGNVYRYNPPRPTPNVEQIYEIQLDSTTSITFGVFSTSATDAGQVADVQSALQIELTKRIEESAADDRIRRLRVCPGRTSDYIMMRFPFNSDGTSPRMYRGATYGPDNVGGDMALHLELVSVSGDQLRTAIRLYR